MPYARRARRLAPARVGLRHWHVLHQRQPPDHRSEDRPLVGRGESRRAVRQDGGGAHFHSRHRRADRGLLQLCRARRDRWSTRRDQRRHPGSDLAVHRGRRSAASVVAVWSLGAAGDQNPIYFQQTYDLRDIRTKEYASRGIDISNAMPPGGQGLDRKDPAVVTADESAEADAAVDGAAARRGSAVRDAEHDAPRIERSRCPAAPRRFSVRAANGRIRAAPALKARTRRPGRWTSAWGCSASAT